MQRWPTKKAWFWETAPFFRLLLPLVAGIVIYQSFITSFNPQALLIPFTIILSLSFILFITSVFINTSSSLIHIARALFLNSTLLFAAWFICFFTDIRNDKNWFGNNMNSVRAYVVRINEPPAQKEKTWKLDVNVLYSIDTNKVYSVTGKAFVYIFKSAYPFRYKQGDTLIIPNKWSSIANTGNPYEFDYAAYCAKNNLYYRQFLPSSAIRRYAHGAATDKSITEQAHNWCMQQLQRYLPDSSATGLIQAMLLGDEENLDDGLLQAYSETGIVHIIAISGGNVAIFFLVISLLLFWLRNKKYTWIKYIVALPLVWFYVIMAGAPPSAIRAAIMFSIVAVGFALQKSNNSLNFLFAAAFLLLCTQPMWLFSVGFQLSFIAVLSLILFYKPIYNWLTPTNFITKGLWSTIAASLAAEILVAPIVIYYFHLFPLLFILANVLAYLFMGLVLILGMAVIMISFIPPVAKLIGWLTVIIVTFFNKIVYWLQNLNPTSFHYLYLKSFELAIVYIVIAGIATFLLKKNKPALFIGMGAACLLLTSFCKNEWEAARQQKLVIFNTSKANYIELIEGKYHHNIIFDSGIDVKKMKYISDPAHTTWHAWRQGVPEVGNVFRVNGNTIFIQDSTNIVYKTFHTDYLIIAHRQDTEPSDLLKTFTPKEVVLTSAITTNTAAKWQQACKENNTKIHIVRSEGAFVIE